MGVAVFCFFFVYVLVHQVSPEFALVEAKGVGSYLFLIEYLADVLIGLVLSAGDGPDTSCHFFDRHGIILHHVLDNSTELVHFFGSSYDCSLLNLAVACLLLALLPSRQLHLSSVLWRRPSSNIIIFSLLLHLLS